MKMVDIEDTNIKKYFKVIKQEPKWLDVDTVATTGNIKYNEYLYLKVNSLLAWSKYMHSPIKHKAWVASQRTEDKDRKKAWSGATSYNDYLDIINNGDDEVMNKIKIETKDAVSDIYKKHEKTIHSYKFDVVGEQFDIGLVLSGVPEVWLEPIIEDEVVTKVSIKIDLTFHSGVKTATVIKNASRLLGIAKVLEDMDVQVKIEAYNFMNNYDNKNRKRLLIVENLVKDFNEPINYRKVSSYITTAQFRRGCFILMEQLAETLSDDYGNQTHCKNIIRIDDDREVTKFENKVFGGV